MILSLLSLPANAVVDQCDDVTLLQVSKMQQLSRSEQGSPRFKTIPMNGLNGNGPLSAPQCVGKDATIDGIYGEPWCFATTVLGGTAGNGVLYRIKPDGSNFSVLWNFNVFTGLIPSYGIAISSNRTTIYGTTSSGGDAGSGLIWAFSFQENTVNVLHSFVGPSGNTPEAGPILVGETLFGICSQAGLYGYGTVWSLSLANLVFTDLHNFAGGSADLANPYGSLLYNPNDGFLYGMPFGGGANKDGGIFSIKPDGTNYDVRALFTPSTGSAPQGAQFALAPNGKLYGNGWLGGAGAGIGGGTVFCFDPSTDALQNVFNYTQATGTHPYSGVTVSKSGKWLYTTTWHGGPNDIGTIVAITIDGSTSKVLLNLTQDVTGGLPFTAANPDADGEYLLFATMVGSDNNLGAVISLAIPHSVM